MIAFLAGLLAGSLHVLSGPDHLAALLPLVAHKERQGFVLGASWGLGHGGGILCWLLLASLLRGVLGGSAISNLAEVLVGVSLIALGLRALFTARSAAERDHSHGAALGMGVLHGTAGAGHLIGVLPTLGLSALGAIQYGAGYCAAAVLAMAGFGALTGTWASRIARPFVLRVSCSVIAVLVGFAWLVGAFSASV